MSSEYVMYDNMTIFFFNTGKKHSFMIKYHLSVTVMSLFDNPISQFISRPTIIQKLYTLYCFSKDINTFNHMRSDLEL